jgi:peptidoglycan/LPS O-acetylase OafA/YrhL
VVAVSGAAAAIVQPGAAGAAGAGDAAGRFARVDQVRGFAALIVVICHMSVSAYVGAPNLGERPLPWLGLLLGFGYLGVPLFFVVSGFCIHWPQARARHDGRADAPGWRAFFQRRFWRLYPAYFASLFVASLGLAAMRFMEYRAKGWPLPLPDHFYEQAFGINEIGYNAVFLLPFFERARELNSVLWTLVFEVQFYLL